MFVPISECSLFLCMRVLANSLSKAYRRRFSLDPHRHVVGDSGIIVVVAASVLTFPDEKRFVIRGVVPVSK